MDVFAPEFRDSKNMHLRNFYAIVPPLVRIAVLKRVILFLELCFLFPLITRANCKLLWKIRQRLTKNCARSKISDAQKCILLRFIRKKLKTNESDESESVVISDHICILNERNGGLIEQ